MLDTVNQLVATNTIPPLDDGQMLALLHYLFTSADRTLRLRVAEVVYRHAHDHAKALDLFLACALPLAQKVAERKARKVFLYPSDWQIELMYDGAVEAVIEVFQRNRPVNSTPDGFRRYFLRALTRNTLRRYFRRMENDSIRSVADFGTVRTPRKPFRNPVEQEIITRELLGQVTNCEYLRAPVLAMLQCIAALGPDGALKEHAYTASGDPDKWERQRGGRPILDPQAIADAMGIRKRDVHRYLCQARVILNQVFNSDGRLFLIH